MLSPNQMDQSSLRSGGPPIQTRSVAGPPPGPVAQRSARRGWEHLSSCPGIKVLESRELFRRAPPTRPLSAVTLRHLCHPSRLRAQLLSVSPSPARGPGWTPDSNGARLLRPRGRGGTRVEASVARFQRPGPARACFFRFPRCRCVGFVHSLIPQTFMQHPRGASSPPGEFQADDGEQSWPGVPGVGAGCPGPWVAPLCPEHWAGPPPSPSAEGGGGMGATGAEAWGRDGRAAWSLGASTRSQGAVISEGPSCLPTRAFCLPLLPA